MTSHPEYNHETNGTEVAATFGEAIRGKIGQFLALRPGIAVPCF